MSKGISSRLTKLERRCQGDGLSEHAQWYAERLEDWPDKYLLDKQGQSLSSERAAEVKVQCRQLAARLRAGEFDEHEDEDRAIWEIAKALPNEVIHGMARFDEMILADELPDDVRDWMERV